MYLILIGSIHKFRNLSSSDIKKIRLISKYLQLFKKYFIVSHTISHRFDFLCFFEYIA